MTKPTKLLLRDIGVAMVWGILLAVIFERPWMVAATTCLYLLPAWAASIWHALAHQADIVVNLDPRQPDPQLLLAAFQQAAQQTHLEGRTIELQIQPLYKSDGHILELTLTLDNKRQLVATAGGTTITGPVRHDWLPWHPLPIVILEQPRPITFRLLADQRLATYLQPETPAAPLWPYAVFSLLTLPLLSPLTITALCAGGLALYRRSTAHSVVSR